MRDSAVEALNAWSPTWSDAMTRGLVEGSAMLLLVGLVWLLGRRWMSSGFACGLFLLVLVKAVASAASPWTVTIPVPFPAAIPISSPVPGLVEIEPRQTERPPDPPDIFSQDERPVVSSPAPAGPLPMVDEPAPRLARASWLMLGWAVIVAGLLGRFVARHVRFARRLRASKEIDPATLAADPARLAERAGLMRPIPLFRSDLIHAPAVWGFLRPRVLIPEGMQEGLSREQVTWILLHEYAHIRRKDAWVALGQRIVQIVFFFHPAVWAANRAADVQREFACDESALALGDVPRRDCGEGLLTIVERARRPRVTLAPMALGLFGSSRLVRRRLERLLDDSRRPSARLSRAALIALAAAALVAAARVQARPQQAPAAPAVAAPQPKPEAAQRTMEVSVVDSRTGRPMPRAEVIMETALARSSGTTDEAGHFRVPIPKGEWIYLNLRGHRDGFVPLADSWRQQSVAAKPIPDQYTFKMEPGSTIGGVIQDERGRPIAGATAFVTIVNMRRSVAGPRPDIRDYPATTDAEGRWRCKIAPRDLPDVLVRLAHPDYISGPNHQETPPDQMPQLRDGSRVMVMKKGLPVSGFVRDAGGRPIAGATVAFGEDQAVNDNPTVTTDARGEFRFAHVAPGDLILVAQAKGHAPDLQQVKVEPRMQPVAFTLGLPHSIRGRIVDGAGKGIPGAWVTDDRWRGYRSLKIKVVADADGRFQIDDLPDEPVEFQFYKEGFMNLPNKALAPSDQDVTITMNRPLTISGTVTDAATGKPIDDFQLLDGHGEGSWDRQRPRRFRDGRYIRNIAWPYPGTVALRVEAEGYLPADSRGFGITEGAVTHDFQLTKGKVPTRHAISGVILLPDGKPAAGAEVALASRTFGLYVKDGRDLDPEKHPRVMSGPDGQFVFPPQAEETFVVALHDQGYVESTEAALAAAPSRALTLRKWGRVEGTLRVGTKPAADQQIVLQPRRSRSGPEWLVQALHFDYSATTDRLGRFAFDRVVPGPANVSRAIATSPHQMSFGPWQAVEVEPGKTAQVRLGGTGRPVIGRFTEPAGSDLAIDWTRTRHRLQLKPPPAPQLRGATKEERSEEYKKWTLTEEGKAYEAWQKDRRNYAFRIEADGSFRIDDVTAGTYEIFVSAEDGAANNRKVLAEVDRTVVVPPMEGGQSVEPLDLGAIEMVPTP